MMRGSHRVILGGPTKDLWREITRDGVRGGVDGGRGLRGGISRYIGLEVMANSRLTVIDGEADPDIDITPGDITAKASPTGNHVGDRFTLPRPWT